MCGLQPVAAHCSPITLRRKQAAAKQIAILCKPWALKTKRERSLFDKMHYPVNLSAINEPLVWFSWGEEVAGWRKSPPCNKCCFSPLHTLSRVSLNRTHTSQQHLHAEVQFLDLNFVFRVAETEMFRCAYIGRVCVRVFEGRGLLKLCGLMVERRSERKIYLWFI